VAATQAQASLRDYLNRDPFKPFVVRMTDGRRLAIPRPPVVFCDGAASFIEPDDGALVEFFHDEVQAFGSLEQGVRA
jgi:hypothetical protein